MARSVGIETQIPIIRNPSWMNQPWRIKTFDPSLGVAYHDTVLFTTPGKVKILRNGHVQQPDWGTSCQLTMTGELSGLTPDNKPFVIKYDSAKRELKCEVKRG